MVRRNNAEPATTHLPEVLALLALSAIVVVVVTLLAALIDLSAGQSIKISVAYVIMGGMLLDRFVPLGA
jgi:hypothetical protein